MKKLDPQATTTEAQNLGRPMQMANPDPPEIIAARMIVDAITELTAQVGRLAVLKEFELGLDEEELELDDLEEEEDDDTSTALDSYPKELTAEDRDQLFRPLEDDEP